VQELRDAARARADLGGGVPFGDAFAGYRRAVVGGEVQGPKQQTEAGAPRARYAARDADDSSGGKGRKGAADRGDQDELARARKEIDGEIQAVKLQTEINKQQYELDFANKKISEDEKKRLVQQADDQEFASIESLYEREKQLIGQKPAHVQDINNKIETLEAQHQLKMLQLQTKEAADAAKAIEQQASAMAGSLTSSLSSALQGLAEHTNTKDAGRKIAQSLFNEMTSELIKSTLTKPLETALQPVLQGISSNITKPIQGVLQNVASGLTGSAGGAAGGASEVAAGGALSSAAALTGAAASLSAAAASLGAGGAAAGAGGAAAGAASSSGGFFGSLAGLLPAFDVGTNFVPHDMPAMIHQGERIVPAADNRMLMSALSGGAAGQGGGGDTHQHFHFSPNITAMDSQDVTRALSGVGGKDLMRMFAGHIKRGASLGLT
jgi:hypothetical protein